ncbi:Benzoate 4-monooxygenase [Penicillium atrosanguineum]|uniref:Benzoate 4-monooxygenase n=1 Tax=Penicillium atrosanguineum TaxID=1132637 RepID=UPI002388F7CD|nr:Benzoate 4-monooxygenase [Penicillium atrosanguineum]KAJ5310908.1 Benzoate 4-monooxygenase [Penicillium atrosanguineum]
MSTGTLCVHDSRTGVKYDIPIRHNAIRALDLQRIRAPSAGSDRADQVSLGIRVHDPGLHNTAAVLIYYKRKLFGYGHRSYKGIDPRVRPIRLILQDLNELSPLLNLAEAIEEAASTDEYFIMSRLYPNADLMGTLCSPACQSFCRFLP